MNKKMNKIIIEHFDETLDVENFSIRLRELLENNNIKQTELAKAIGVDNQTISNWLNANNGYRPKWVDYMYKLNEFLYRYVDNYSPLNLFTMGYNRLVDATEYYRKQEEDRIGKNKLEVERHLVLLNTINTNLERGKEWKGIDFASLFRKNKFYDLIQQINEKHCLHKKTDSSGKNYYSINLKEELFNFIVKFLNESNKK